MMDPFILLWVCCAASYALYLVWRRQGFPGDYRIKRQYGPFVPTQWLVQQKRGWFWYTVLHCESFEAALMAAKRHSRNPPPRSPARITYLGSL